jgi:hypothetical protein
MHRKIYKTTRQIPNAGDGVLNYRSYASNGTVDAIGDPATTDKPSPWSARPPRRGAHDRRGAPGNNYQAGIDAVPQNGTVLVYPGPT